MKYFSKNDEARIMNVVKAAFPDYKISFMQDPDDESVVLVRLYDVAEQDAKTFKDRLYEVLDRESQGMNAEFIASIVSSDDTRRYYADYLRGEALIDEDVARLNQAYGKCPSLNNRDYTWDANTSKIVAGAKMGGVYGYRLAA